MEELGHLVWWKVGNPGLTRDELQAILAALDLEDLAPRPIVPIDAFRRLTGEARSTYAVDDSTITLDLHRATSQHTMLVRHMVRTVTSLSEPGVVTSIDRVGEVAFYKPPKGQPQRARVRVTIHPESLPDREQIEQFAEFLRTEWKAALSHLDAQAIRRLIRQYLAKVQAIYLDGPYFIEHLDDVERLMDLFSHLGKGSKCQTIPVIDDEPRRAMIAAAANDAHQQGCGLDEGGADDDGS